MGITERGEREQKIENQCEELIMTENFPDWVRKKETQVPDTVYHTRGPQEDIA